ncbi:proline-rich protein 23A-like [Erinaceus europaeus]|uniref:Proline-rich protein 23A-like n=1 Tax=Erinaceus europaeus TaxID=9365 RepID=A0ABM3WTK6_ERIEU|nr:proline-rich protein 23A-like [Erinaceus europaeus]
MARRPRSSGDFPASWEEAQLGGLHPEKRPRTGECGEPVNGLSCSNLGALDNVIIIDPSDLETHFLGTVSHEEVCEVQEPSEDNCELQEPLEEACELQGLPEEACDLHAPLDEIAAELQEDQEEAPALEDAQEENYQLFVLPGEVYHVIILQEDIYQIYYLELEASEHPTGHQPYMSPDPGYQPGLQLSAAGASGLHLQGCLAEPSIWAPTPSPQRSSSESYFSLQSQVQELLLNSVLRPLPPSPSPSGPPELPKRPMGPHPKARRRLFQE